MAKQTRTRSKEYEENQETRGMRRVHPWVPVDCEKAVKRALAKMRRMFLAGQATDTILAAIFQPSAIADRPAPPIQPNIAESEVKELQRKLDQQSRNILARVAALLRTGNPDVIARLDARVRLTEDQLNRHVKVTGACQLSPTELAAAVAQALQSQGGAPGRQL